MSGSSVHEVIEREDKIEKEDLGIINEVENCTLTSKASYRAARSRLTEAEMTSNIELEDHLKEPRRRFVKNIRLPGESSSDDESHVTKRKKQNKQSVAKKRCIKKTPDPLPAPLAPSMITETMESQSLMDGSFHQTAQFDAQENEIQQLRDNQASMWSMLQNVAAKINSPRENMSINPKPFEAKDNDEIQLLPCNQETMWSVLIDLHSICTRNSEKLDLLLRKIDSLETVKDKADPEELNFLSLLPVGIDNLEILNNKISGSNSFRQNLIRILMTSGGRDSRAIAINVLRKTLSDDIGVKFSLTGKQSRNGLPKLSFEKTAIYKVILETCFRIHKDAKENVVREAISDWLMQAKFRKNRREMRKSQQPE